MSKTICIYHRIDLDGWMSAAIVKKWWLNNTVGKITLDADNLIIKPMDTLTFLGWNYGDTIPDLSDYDKVIMCDISFPKETMLNINKKLGENFIWIDHHQRTIDEVNSYIIDNGIPMEGLLTEQGELKAACELTWQYFFPNETMPEIVRLLGRYDCFGHKGTDEETKVLEFQYGARQVISTYQEAYNYLSKELYDIEELKGKNDDRFDWSDLNNIVEQIHNQGKAIYQYLCTEAKWIYKIGKEIELMEPSIGDVQYGATTRKFLAINRSRFNPINFGIDYHTDGYDGIMSYNYNKDKWTASLYNDNGQVDCSMIAKTFGGGGHKGAAGFVGNTELFKSILEWL